MALAIDSSTPAPTIPTAATGMSSITSNSFTPPVGAVLVVLFANGSNGNFSTTLTDSLGTHLTYTQQTSTFNANAAGNIFTSSPVVTSTSMTITTGSSLGTPAGNELILVVLVFTGAATTQTGKVKTGTSNAGTPSLTFPAGTSSTSWLVASFATTQATGPTIPAGQTDVFNGSTCLQNNSTAASWIQGNNAVGNSNLTINDTAPTGIQFAACAYEVQAAPPPASSSPFMVYLPRTRFYRQPPYTGPLWLQRQQPVGSVASGGNQFTQELDASVVLTGASTRGIGKLLAAALVLTGARGATVVRKGITGAFTATGAITRSIGHSLTGALMFSGNLTKQTIRTITGSLLAVGAVTTQAVHHFTQALAGNLVAAGSLAKSTAHQLAGALAFAGALQRSVAKSITGSLVLAGSQARSIVHQFTGALLGAGALTRRTAHSLSGNLLAAGSVLTGSLRKQALSGALAVSGAMQRTTLKALSGTVTASGAITRATVHGLAATLAATGNVTRVVRSHLAGALVVAGATTKRTLRTLSAALSLAGSVVPSRLRGVVLNAALQASGALSTTKSRFLLILHAGITAVRQTFARVSPFQTKGVDGTSAPEQTVTRTSPKQTTGTVSPQQKDADEI